MVKRLVTLLVLLPSLLFSKQFTATVSQNQILLGESFTLDLTLTGVSAKAPPDTKPLKETFIIHNERQSSNTTIINGKISSSSSWRLTLIPYKEGNVIIPPIEIHTAEGVLSTDPIALNILKGTSQKNSVESDGLGMTLTTHISNPSPFKNEPFVYTVKLIAKENVANVKIQNFAIEDALINPIGEPEVEEKIVDGIRVKMIAFRYLITPVKEGALILAPVVIQGAIPEKRKHRISSFFDRDFEPFSMMGGLNYLKPFALATEEIMLEVQPPVEGINPWLPAKALHIEETFDDSQKLQVGEPILRKIIITADGVQANQLPSVNEMGKNQRSYNIYADKPELTDKMVKGIIQGRREEQYTIILQKPGKVTLPAIKLAWWDTVNKKKAFTTLPEKTLDVLPAPAEEIVEVGQLESGVKNDEPPIEINKKNPLNIVLLAVFALLVGALIWIFTLQKKVAKLKGSQKGTPNKQGDEKKETLPDLNPT